MDDELKSLLSQAVWKLKSVLSLGESQKAKHYSRVIVNLTDAIMMFKYQNAESDGEDWKDKS